MAKKRDEISEEEAVKRAKEELGEETIAKFQGLSPDIKAALLREISPPPPPKKHAGGRKKGSGLDYTPYLRRMAELQIEEPELEDHPASRRVKEEFQALGVHLSSETLRTYYRPRKPALLAAIREERRPRPRVVVTTTAAPIPRAAGAYSPSSVADYAMGAAGYVDAMEAAKRAILEPDLRTFLGPSPEELARILALPAFPDYAQELAKAAISPGASLAAAEEEIRRIKEAFSGEALRGLAAILGKKPPY